MTTQRGGIHNYLSRVGQRINKYYKNKIYLLKFYLQIVIYLLYISYNKYANVTDVRIAGFSTVLNSGLCPSLKSRYVLSANHMLCRTDDAFMIYRFSETK